MQSANASLFGPNPLFYISYIYDTTAFASFVHPEFATDVRDLWVICTLPSRPIWYVDPKHDEPGQVCCPWMRARAGDLVVSDPKRAVDKATGWKPMLHCLSECRAISGLG